MTAALDDHLDRTFAALANGTRRAMLARLSEGAATVSELAEPFAMSMPAISKHLKVLEQAGLVRRSRDAQFRPCHLAPDALAPASEWIEQRRSTWETSFDRLARHLDDLQSEPPEQEEPHEHT